MLGARAERDRSRICCQPDLGNLTGNQDIRGADLEDRSSPAILDVTCRLPRSGMVVIDASGLVIVVALQARRIGTDEWHVRNRTFPLLLKVV